MEQSAMVPSSNNCSKSEALARARAWRDQRCATPPTSAKKPKKEAAAESSPAMSPLVSRNKAPPPETEALSLAVASSTPKHDAKDRALTRAREYAARLKEKKIPTDDDVELITGNYIGSNNVPAVVDIETEDLSSASITVSAAPRKNISPEEIISIAADMKKLSERLDALKGGL